MSREVLVDTFEWTTDSPPLATVYSKAAFTAVEDRTLAKYEFPSAIYAAAPNIVDKLAHYKYFRSDIEITIRVNSTPFLQGALLMNHCPSNREATPFIERTSQTLASASSFPSVIMDLRMQNVIKLIIPYMNEFDLFDQADANDQFGEVRIFVLSKLQGEISPEKVEVSVFARFVNPKVVVPTSLDVLTKHRVDHARKLLGRYAPEGKEGEAGFISGIAGAVGTIAGGLSAVPVIGKFAAPVSAISNAVAGVASAFGFSKPITEKIATQVVPKTNQSMVHQVGIDHGVCLASNQDTLVDGSEVAHTAEDEMSLAYILQRWNLFKSVLTTQAGWVKGSLLLEWVVSPWVRECHSDTVVPEQIYPGSFTFTSSLYRYWRGTIEYNIKLIRTQYHSGRFAIVFFPGTGSAPATLGDALHTAYSIVVDISDQAEIDSWSFRVPYISNEMWKYTTDYFGEQPDHSRDSYTGTVGIYCLNALVRPDTVADSVHFLISMRGGSDYRLAFPEVSLVPQYKFSIATDPTEPTDSFPPTEICQSEGLLGEVMTPDSVDGLVAGPRSLQGTYSEEAGEMETWLDFIPADITQLPEKSTVGEVQTSLRSYIKQTCHVFDLTPLGDSYASYHPLSQFNTNGDGRRQSYIRSGQIALPETHLSIARYLYRYYTGSVNLKFLANGMFQTTTTGLSKYLQDLGNVEQNIAYNNRRHVNNSSVNPLTEVNVPFYSRFRCRALFNTTSKQNDSTTQVIVRATPGFTGDGTLSVFESGGDDLSFMYMVGPPPCIRAQDGVVATVPTV